MKFVLVITYLLVLMLPATSFAHGGGGNTYTKKYQRQKTHKPAPATIAAADRYQLSIHINGKQVHLTVNDNNGKPVELGMSSATVFVLSGTTDSHFKLYADDNNLLVGSGEFEETKDLKFEVSIHIAGEKPFSASFKPFVSDKPTSVR